MSSNWGHTLLFFPFSFVSTSLFVPTYIFAKQQVKLFQCVCMWVLPTVEQSAKCHLSTCALMINTILMVSINFLLHHQKAAVALSLSWPCACFGKPLCGSCWMEIACFSLPHTHNFYRQMYPTCTHTRDHTRQYLMENTHAHYYTLLCSSHFTHSHADKQIKCNSVLLLDHF